MLFKYSSEDCFIINFDILDCLEQHYYFQNCYSYYYDEKELYSTYVILLKNCCDEESCVYILVLQFITIIRII